MSTLEEITGVERHLLRKKFQLEPHFSYDPNQSENLAFMSPLVLLKDSDLKPGGYNDRGPKTTLGRIAKDILEPDGHKLFQVPELTYLHLGYAKKSANKKGKMAINEKAARKWKTFLDMSRFSHATSPREPTSATIPSEPTSATSPSEPTSNDDEPMEIDLPNAADTQALEVESTEPDLVQPCKSGLKIPLKGRYMLLFSILLIFQDKKKKKKVGELYTSRNEDEIGPNKVSDFLLFWILPHLLSYNHRKVEQLIQHHQNRKSQFENFVEKSAAEIIEESLASSEISDELQDVISEKYRDCYGEKMDVKYKLLKTKEETPIILVPKEYQVKDMPVRLEDIGKSWRELGDVRLFDEFMKRFIKNREIQEDFFQLLRDSKGRQGINYAIILPNETTFNKLIGSLREKSAQFLTKVTKGHGRNDIVPDMALVTAEKTNLTICFSYFKGTRSANLAALFRAVGAHHLDHFALAFLHGLWLDFRDPEWELKLGSLYSVTKAREILFTEHSLDMKGIKGTEPHDFSEAKGRFCRADFPETFESWEQTVLEDQFVKKINSKKEGIQPRISPKFEKDEAFTVGYSAASKKYKLKKLPTRADQRLKKYEVKAVNLDGCLLSSLSKYGRKNNIGLVLAIADYCDVEGSLVPQLSDATESIITSFVQAIIVAGLPEVYPTEPDEVDRDDTEFSSRPDDDDDDDDEDDDEDDDTDEPASASAFASRPAATSISASERPSKPQAGTIKEGTVTDDKLLDLARDVVKFWKNLGRELQIPEARLDEIDIDYQGQGVVEKAYQMLLSWRDKCYPSNTFRCIYDVLSNQRLNCRELAIKHCC